LSLASFSLIIAWASLCVAALPALLTLANLRLFYGPPARRSAAAASPPAVSVLVPARNEEAAISRLIDDVLASENLNLELVILDDGSEDATAAIVATRAAADSRVRLLSGTPLPPGWCGKQHACWQLAAGARHDTWVFLDVDVSLRPDALVRAVEFLETTNAGLVSGFPRQLTGSFLEWLLLPLIHFVLLGFLPLGRSREVNDPSLAAGCGQLFVTRRADYERAGGHAAISASLHDGVKLPRAYRRAGLLTDIFDATEIASCRMYARSPDVWRGLSKNATEGIGAAAAILPFTILLGVGQVAPALLLGFGLANGFASWPQGTLPVVAAALVLGLFTRVVQAIRFRLPLASVGFHPLAVAVFLLIQWVALGRKALGLRTTWRGRALAPQ